MTEARNDSPIKEYETVHRHDDTVTFRIFRTEDHYAEFGGKADPSLGVHRLLVRTDETHPFDSSCFR